MQDTNKCVYLHKDKEGIVRYIGSGTEYRAYQTWSNSGRGGKYAEFVEANGKLEVEVVANGLTKLEAEDLERELFDKYEESILNQRRPSSARLISKEMFEEYLYYDETSKSCLRWKVDLGQRVKADSEAGSLNKNGYHVVQLQGVLYLSHRVVAALHNLEVNGYVIDHINRNRSDNRISNLRAVTQKENMQNINRHRLSSANTSGFQGVSYDRCQDRWISSWYESGILKHKCFSTKNYASSEEALEAAIKYRQEMMELYY